MGKIIEHWNSKGRTLPGIDCIVFPDDRVIILTFYDVYNTNTDEKKRYCNPLCDTTIDSIEKYNTEYWTVVDTWASIDYQGGKIYGGYGVMDNEGFIAHVDIDDNLIWGMFFENTNPIKSLEVKGNILIAVNEYSDLQVEVNLDVLTDIKIVIIE